METRSPFAMVAREQNRFLSLSHAKALVCGCGIVVAREIATFGIEIDRLQIDAVLRRELLLQGHGQIELIQVVVLSLPVLGPIVGLNGETTVTAPAVHRSCLNPISVAEILGA